MIAFHKTPTGQAASSAPDFVPPDEREAYYEFVICLPIASLPMKGRADFAAEVSQCAWRIRRCQVIECQELTGDLNPEELDSQSSSQPGHQRRQFLYK